MQELFEKTEHKMQKTQNALLEEYSTIRAGRANAGILDKVQVEYYGVPTPIQQMAAISIPDARTLVITPWDKTTLRDIERAIIASDIGINPQNDGACLRLVFPPLTEERRRELCKQIDKYGEEAKVAVRTVRRDAMEKLKEMKKQSEITEDDQKIGEKKLQDLTDKYCKSIDKEAEAKSQDIMSL